MPFIKACLIASDHPSYHLHRSSLQKTSGNSLAETSRSQLIATEFKDVFDELMNQ